MRKHAYITIPSDYDVYVHLALEEIFLIELSSPLGERDKILFILSCHSPGCDGKDLEALKMWQGPQLWPQPAADFQPHSNYTHRALATLWLASRPSGSPKVPPPASTRTSLSPRAAVSGLPARGT